MFNLNDYYIRISATLKIIYQQCEKLSVSRNPYCNIYISIINLNAIFFSNTKYKVMNHSHRANRKFDIINVYLRI